MTRRVCAAALILGVAALDTCLLASAGPEEQKQGNTGSYEELCSLANSKNELKRNEELPKYRDKELLWTSYVYDVTALDSSDSLTSRVYGPHIASARVFMRQEDSQTSTHRADTCTIYLLFREDQRNQAANLEKGQKIRYKAKLSKLEGLGGTNLGILLEEVTIFK